MKHRELTEKIIGCAYRVYNRMGYGFLGLINFGERKVEIKRKVRNFDDGFQDDFSSFNPEYPVNPVKKVSLKDLNCYPKSRF